MGALSVVSQQRRFLDLILEGKSERQVLLELNIPYSEYILFLTKSKKFCEDLEIAKKKRADVWFSKIIEDVDRVADKDEVGGERLRFDKLKYLAAIDSPEKYSERSKETPEIKLTLNDFKGLSTEDAKKILENDPFSVVDAEFSPKAEEDSELL
jgi:hypothetical protein